MKPRRLHLSLLFIAGFLVSCSDAPAPPAKGTPAFSWSAAKESYAAGDYEKTLDHLGRISNSANEFRNQAMPWRLVLLSGLSRGYMELADEYEAGSKANKINPTPFRRQLSTLRSEASAMALDFAESFASLKKSQPTGDIAIAMTYPPIGSLQPVVTRIGGGIQITPLEAATARKKFTQRAVLLATCRSLGNQEDDARTKEMMAKAPLTLPRDTFFLAAAETLLAQSSLFSRTKLDIPDREKLFKERALDALEGMPDSKELKDLRRKIQAPSKKS